MDRRVSLRAALVVGLLAASACQDYNFNPVGHCLIQPGTRRVKISDVSTADVLFVVDDSGSMGDEQQAIKDNFASFMGVLVKANQERVANALNPIDFHMAVTSTASYYNEAPAGGAVCSDQCPGATGAKVCCLQQNAPTDPSLKSPEPPRCQANADCNTGAGYECRSDCFNGAAVYGKACCKPGVNAVDRKAQPVACTTVGEACGNFDPFYYYDGTCNMGYVDDAAPVTTAGFTNYRYPAGKFMSPASNGKVIHFPKTLNWAGGVTDPTIQPLATDFGENVMVGTCGSPQEQGLEPARRALQAVRGLDGLSQPITAGEFLHDKSKLVVVWISDEDDCSAPYSAGEGVVYALATGCMRDLDGDGQFTDPDPREYDLARYADYFTSLGRPFGAAFIAEANTGCADLSCFPQVCCSGAGCSGQERVPTRYLSLASTLSARGADVVVGSICDSFGTTLGRIAEIVKPPTGLTLPTVPAAAEVAILRIARPDGSTRKTCNGPAPAFKDPPTNTIPMTKADAEAGGYDWWFVTDTGKTAPSPVSAYIYINHLTGNCEANSGETYSADYIGQIPAGGCRPTLSDPGTFPTCDQALGGKASDWICEGYDSVVLRAGTCVCNS
jgi:hypothetical protein